jgi:CRISPR system Cascade subunit CasC
VDKGRDGNEAIANINALLGGAKLKTAPPKEEGEVHKTEYLLYLPARKIEALSQLVDDNWEELTKVAGAGGTGEPEAKGKKGKKKEQAAAVPKEAKDATIKLLQDARQTPEIALFGRMIADNPDWNVEACCQVAHAISTHRISMEFDFFTAVDDLKKDSETGSDMMGTIQFNSACFYRYAVIDVEGLQENLGGAEQRDLALNATRAFLQAFVHARPTGKQNSMAANTLPVLVLFAVRDGDSVSLANAFVKPVVGSAERDLVTASCDALNAHFAKMSKMYPGGLTAAHACTLDAMDWQTELVRSHESVQEAINAACEALSSKARAA